MANTRSAEKQARASLRRRAINQATTTLVKNSEKKIRALVTAGKKDEAAKLLPAFQATIDKASKKGVLHRNTSSRHKSRVAALLSTKPAAA